MAEATTRMTPSGRGPARRAKPQAGPRPFEQLRTEVDRLLDDFLRGYWHVPFRRSAVDVEPYWRGDVTFGATPAVDIVDKDDAYKLSAELPGVDERHVEITFSNGTLTIEGEKQEDAADAKDEHFVSERLYGGFHRTFRVPDGVDADKVDARFKDGVLVVTLPKTAEARKKHKTIPVRSA